MKVILYTGGLDSFIGLWLLRKQTDGEWVPVYFDTRLDYTWKEKQSFADNRREGERIRIIYDILDLTTLQATGDGDPYIPQRNTLLCTAVQAVYDGAVTDIALCSVADDIYRDNGTAFHRRMSDLLSITAGYEVRVFTPLVAGPGATLPITKEEAIQKYLELGGDAKALRKTVSCYDSRMVSCGRCKACERHLEALRTIGPVSSPSA